MDVNAFAWQNTDSGLDSQLWSFIPINVTNSVYKIRNKCSGLALTSYPTDSYEPSFQTELVSARNDQLVLLQNSTNGCFIKVFPFDNYLTIHMCPFQPNTLETWHNVENQIPGGNCQQFILKEASKHNVQKFNKGTNEV